MKIFTTILVVMALSSYSTARANEELIKCRLMTTAVTESTHSLAEESGSIGAFRDTGICISEDGRAFNKNYVVVNNAKSDFSEGQYNGYSDYTDEDGDMLLLKFSGGWSSSGNSAEYTILSGTGKYKGASGTGVIKGLDGPWESTPWFDIEIKVEFP